MIALCGDAGLPELDFEQRTGSFVVTLWRDLAELLGKGIVMKAGTTGKGVNYRLAKGATKGPKGP